MRVCECICVYEHKLVVLNEPRTSQGLGKAEVFLGSAVFFAISDAVTAARRHTGLTETFTLKS